MSGIHNKIETAANLAIIGAVLLLGAVAAQRFWNKPETDARRPAVKVGEQFPLSGYDWSGSEKNLVMVLQKGCHFCTESAPFYQRLAKAAQEKGARLVAALPQDGDTARQYLKELSVPVSDIRQVVMADLKIQGTPTLLLVNKNGAVDAVWVGKLPSDKEEEVLERLR